ncbi:hypothetical protein C8F01DRAFT_997293 [Mycena amicta]|nr:hypothetical protein C8F01DRAFT_997293 [Mycena amicta]
MLTESVPAPATHGRFNANRDSSNNRREPANRLRSASPARRTPLPAQGAAFFQQGTTRSDGLSACAVCLGRHRHSVRDCNSPTLWNGSTKAHSKRNADGRLVNAQGDALCLNWQRSSCESNHSSHHECSGCGSTNHGAQKCHLTQKL